MKTGKEKAKECLMNDLMGLVTVDDPMAFEVLGKALDDDAEYTEGLEADTQELLSELDAATEEIRALGQEIDDLKSEMADNNSWEGLQSVLDYNIHSI